MSAITDAVFFLKNGQVVQEMMKSEFDALLDGIVDAPQFKGRKVAAVYMQITEQLKIKALAFFVISFDGEGKVSADWNVPINQLMQGADRGPDLGAGRIRLVCKSKCNVPWHKESLWEPNQKVFVELVEVVKENRLGIAESDDAWDEEFDDIPVLDAEPPILSAIPTIVPTVTPAQAQKAAPATNEVSADYDTLKKEFDAMKAAYGVRIDKLQKERDELRARNKTISESLKQQARQHAEQMALDFRQDLEKKDSHIEALRAQLDNAQQRYAELKEQQVEQATQYQLEREELMDKLQHGQDVESGKIDALKSAFKKELGARLDAETAKLNEKLAMREVELFYREEQMTLLRDEMAQVRAEKQALLKEKGNNVLESLEDNGVTLVVFQPGVGHITLAVDDVGHFLDDRDDYLASRCGVSMEAFQAWQKHHDNPVCRHTEEGKQCGQNLKPVELVEQFTPGVSDRCKAHQEK